MKIEEYDSRLAPDDLLHGIHDVLAASEAEDLPDDPPMPFEQRRARMRAPVASHNQFFRWTAQEDGQVVGSAMALRWPDDDPDPGLVMLSVLPSHRRRGIATAMLDEALTLIEAEGSSRVIIDCTDGRPWEEALGSLGLKSVLGEKRSRLYMRDVDHDLIDRWIRQAGDRAPDYALVAFDSPVPEAYLESFCQVQNVMNTAPLEGLELADRLMTPEKLRSIETTIHDRGDRMLVLAAVHSETGNFVGYTDVMVQKYQRDQAFQSDTAVDPAHRNKGLGRLLKAAMAKRLLDEHPEVDRIDTYNVGSNAPMLAINLEMGFQPILTINAWQGDLAEVRANLASWVTPLASEL